MSPFPARVATVAVAGALLTACVTACGSSRPSTPISATTPTATGPAIPNSATSYTVSGLVTKNGRPIAGANVNAFVQSPAFGYSYMWAHGAVLTDANGGFRLPELAASATVWMQVYKDGYVQQCAASPITIQGDGSVNLQLVSRAHVTAASQMEPRTVSGVVVEMTAAGKQQVAGASVDFEPLEDFPAAITYTDAAGRFALCGLPQSQSVNLGASTGGRVASVIVPAGQTSVEIMLP